MVNNLNLHNNKNSIYSAVARSSKTTSLPLRKPVALLTEYSSIEIASMQVTYTKRAHSMVYKAHCAISVLSYSIAEIQAEIIQIIESLVADQFAKINVASKKINISCDVKK